MQINYKLYNPDIHEHYRALTIKQPYADAVANGLKTIEVRSRRTNYRGQLLILSAKTPQIKGRLSSACLALVDVTGCKPVEDFTEADWEQTRIPKSKRNKIRTGYGWILSNAKRVIELPVVGRLGIFNIAFEKGDIMTYPQNVILDNKAWEEIQAKNKALREEKPKDNKVIARK